MAIKWCAAFLESCTDRCRPGKFALQE